MCPSKAIAVAVFCSISWAAGADQIHKHSIDPVMVSTVDIEKRGEKPRRLNAEGTERFVQSWNEAKSIGPCKYAAEYWFRVRLKDGRSLELRANGSTIKSTETKDHCFSVTEAKLFSALWGGQC